MITIKDCDGKDCFLSDDIFIVKDVSPLFVECSNYHVGTRVRLISGVDDSIIPGYHFSKGYVTVCRVDANIADFLGFKRSQIEKAG